MATRNPSARGVFLISTTSPWQRGPTVDGEATSRCVFTGGDFFKSVPTAGDVYVLKYIIHDWDDARSRTILTNCHKAMASKGKLLLVEDLACGPNQPCQAKIVDITMLVRTGGQNRTEQEYRGLLTQSGFEVLG